MNDRATLAEILDAEIDDKGRAWLLQAQETLRKLQGDADTLINRLVFYTASAPRKLAVRPLRGTLSSGLPEDLYRERAIVFLDHWTTADAARVLLLAECIEFHPYPADELFQLCYRYSDDGERASLLRGLALLPVTGASTEFIVDAARTNSLQLFSALMHHNPWPASHFPVAAFNQTVLKSLFLGLDISQIIGLRAALNPELGRMTADYVQERLDAYREVPASIWLVVDAGKLTQESVDAWIAFLDSDDASRRRLARLSCAWQTNLPEALRDRCAEVNSRPLP